MRKPTRMTPSDRADDAALGAAMQERLPAASPWSLGIRAISVALSFAGLWYAIRYRGAGVGALFVPTLAEIAASVVLGIGLALFVVRDPKFRHEALSTPLPFWSIVIAGVLFWQHSKGNELGRSFGEQLDFQWQQLLVMIKRQHLHWAIIAAVGGLLCATAHDLLSYFRTGGRFVWLAPLTLGLRVFALFVLGMWSLVFLVEANRRQAAQVAWFLLLLAELFALWLPWAVRRKMDAQSDGQSKARPPQAYDRRSE